MLSVGALGCHAQNKLPVAGVQNMAAQNIQVGVKLSPEMARRVEVMLRSKSQLPLDSEIAVSEPVRSDIPGWDQINVTFTAKGVTSRPLPFLLSTDGKTLAQLNRFDLTQDPKEKVSAAGRPARGGPENAPVLIVGFDDLECPYCAKMHAEIFPAILNRYKNQIRIVYRDFPLEEIHPWAMHGAIDANCLGATSTPAYWNYIDYVHAHADEMAGPEKSAAKANQTLDKLAFDEGGRQKLNQSELTACILKQDVSQVKASIKDGESDTLRVDSTPVLFVNGEKVEGVVPIESLYRVIDSALVAAGQTPPPPVTSPQPTPPAAKPGS
jgi:protein-disulfide isomerase